MNSKAEYNRCKVHRIETKPTKSQYRETLIEAEKENLFREGLKELNLAKCSMPKASKAEKTVDDMRKV